MPRMTGGQAIVKSLLAHRVDTVFGIPGAQIYGLFDALYEAREQINVIGARHEQATAYMAFGYSRSTGRPGVYAVVPGPGVLNTTAALSTAYGCNLPVLCLTGQVPSPFIGRGFGHLHELPDQLGTLKSLSKWAQRISTPAQASSAVANAFQVMRSGKPGPAALEMPWEVFDAEGDVSIEAARPIPVPAVPDADAVERVATIIAGARRPIIAVGSGALGAVEEINRLSSRLRAPVMAFRSGRGIVPEDAPLGLNIVAAWELWHDCDLVIGVGSRLELTHLRWPYRPAGQKLVRIDIDPLAMERLPPDAGVVADAATATGAILEALEKRDVRAEAQQELVRAAKQKAAVMIATVTPHVPYLEAIRAALPREGFFVEELCQAGYASYYGFPVLEPRTYVSPGYQGTLGFGFNAALGVKAAHPDRPVVSISGDGGFMFGVQELATAAQYGLGVVAVVFDNSAFGNVRRDQLSSYGGRLIGSELRNPDFVRLAESFGIAGCRVERPEVLRATLERLLEKDSPALIHVPVDVDGEVNPWPLSHPAHPDLGRPGPATAGRKMD
jgi:acetolactate synthase-1/2/3 large subunit